MISFDAPKELNRWLDGSLTKIREKGVEVEVRRPSEADRFNKAMVGLSAEPLLCSLTVWGNGMIELIIVNSVTKQDLIFEDIECSSKIEVLEMLDRSLEKFFGSMDGEVEDN